MRRTASSLLLKSLAAFSTETLNRRPIPLPLPFPSAVPARWRPLLSNHGRLGFSTGGAAVDYLKEVDEINLKFAEAREEIEAAMESKETIYFDEEAECAREAVKTVLDQFEGLLGRLPEKDQTALKRSMGLKIEQLKAELKQLDDE
ncbi:embryogenesis-like protein [Curcuma longa]|uniref:embryogenesis-like protein n=1 Tax=Curcuma longa TaxID=136217 RepID=UPI003D9F7355